MGKSPLLSLSMLVTAYFSSESAPCVFKISQNRNNFVHMINKLKEPHVEVYIKKKLTLRVPRSYTTAEFLSLPHVNMRLLATHWHE